MSADSWWVCRTWEGGLWYLPVGDGENLRQLLSARKQKDSDEQSMFFEVEDVSGSPVLIRVDYIIVLWLSTPASRAAEDDPEGALETIRARSQATAGKKWDEPL